MPPTASAQHDYQIQDSISGKTVTVSGDHAPTQQDAEEIFNKAGLRGQSPAQPTQGMFMGLHGALGGLGNLLDPLAKGAQLVTEAGAEAKNALTGQGRPTGIVDSATQTLLNNRTQAGGDFLQTENHNGTPSNPYQNSNPTTQAILNQGGKTAVEAGASIEGLKGAGVAAKTGLSKVADLAGFLNKIATNPKSFTGLADAADTAATNGADISWNTIVQNAKTAAGNKATSVQKALDSLIAEETPTEESSVVKSNVSGIPNEVNQIPDASKPGGGKLGYGGPLRENIPYSGGDNLDISSPNISSTKALDLRRSLGDRLPQSFFDNFTNKTTQPERTAINILRREVSSQLKTAAPDIKSPDELYHFYKNIKGDVPIWAKRIVGGMIADKLVGNKLGGGGREFVDALGTLIASGGAGII